MVNGPFPLGLCQGEQLVHCSREHRQRKLHLMAARKERGERGKGRERARTERERKKKRREEYDAKMRQRDENKRARILISPSRVHAL